MLDQELSKCPNVVIGTGPQGYLGARELVPGVITLSNLQQATDVVTGWKRIATCDLKTPRAGYDAGWISGAVSCDGITAVGAPITPNKQPLKTIQALLTFGTEGTTQFKIFDVGRGQEFAVPASYATLAIRNIEESPFFTLEAHARGVLSKGRKPGDYKLTASFWQTLTGDDTFAVPPFANTFAVYRNDITEALQILVSRLGPVPIVTSEFSLPAGVNFANGDLAQAAEIEIIGTPGVQATVVFGLA